MNLSSTVWASVIVLVISCHNVFGGVSESFSRNSGALVGVRFHNRADGFGAGVLLDGEDRNENITCLYIHTQPFIQTAVYLSNRSVVATKPCEKLNEGIVRFYECPPSDVQPTVIATFSQLLKNFCQVEKRLKMTKAKELVQQTQQCHHSHAQRLTDRFQSCIQKLMSRDGEYSVDTQTIFECLKQGSFAMAMNGCEEESVSNAMKTFFSVFLQVIQADS